MSMSLVARCAGIAVISIYCGQTYAQPQPGSISGKRRVATPEVLAHLPTPTILPGELPRPCVDDYKKLKRLEFQSPTAQSRWAADPALMGTLQYWAEKYFGIPIRKFECMDMPFTVLKFQETTGAAPTGRLSDDDIERIAAALEAGAKDNATAISAAGAAHENSWKTGVTLFGIELGSIVPNLPQCGFDLSDRRPTCLAGQPMSGAVDLYFAKPELPAIVSGGSGAIKLRIAAVRSPDQIRKGVVATAEREYRIVSMSFPTRQSALPEFEAKFGAPRIETQGWQNNFGAKWESKHYVWTPAPNVSISIACGVEFDGGCNASANLRRSEDRPQPSTGRRL